MLSLIPKSLTRNSVHDFTTLLSHGIKANSFGKTAARKISSSFQSPPKIDPYADKTLSELEEILRKDINQLQIKTNEFCKLTQIFIEMGDKRWWCGKAIRVLNLVMALIIVYRIFVYPHLSLSKKDEITQL